MVWRKRIPLELGAELDPNIVFRTAGFEGLDVEDVIFAVKLAPAFAFAFLQLHANNNSNSDQLNSLESIQTPSTRLFIMSFHI